MTTYALLLRGINVGRNRRIGMADLRSLLTGEGYQGVATLLQSGNVVLATDRPRRELRDAVETAIEKRFGMRVDVILRDRDELAAVVAHNPLRDVAHDGSRYAVCFLDEPLTTPLDTLLSGIDPAGDRFAAKGSELYVWCPHGLSKSPVMTALSKRTNGPSATVRNWNTAEKLLSMMDGVPAGTTS
ncbi:DUF1697 domain-containing protein [Catenuloplanes atrovinosus]|uniref:Uncharacterized protein (DUF1697 family) n=1 Tax=Catenuloplanes atrovinosus TaxID=137266 RepID=A0AAE3YL02_9ACTN|nr:DUF1697 domain-containing protein [Catenuloplanes atrovinosus]MDR7274852.1 uncharacterized protein (DUF1697 family) [Catenuloplanes atrovinosus]